jgi:hypothetical protein
VARAWADHWPPSRVDKKNGKGKKGKVALQQAIKAQQGSTGIALLVLSPRPQPWFDPRTIQSVACRYPDYAILAHEIKNGWN